MERTSLMLALQGFGLLSSLAIIAAQVVIAVVFVQSVQRRAFTLFLVAAGLDLVCLIAFHLVPTLVSLLLLRFDLGTERFLEVEELLLFAVGLVRAAGAICSLLAIVELARIAARPRTA